MPWARPLSAHNGTEKTGSDDNLPSRTRSGRTPSTDPLSGEPYSTRAQLTYCINRLSFGNCGPNRKTKATTIMVEIILGETPDDT